LLRATAGVTKRANSAIPPDDSVRQRSGLPTVVDFYRDRGLPVTVQLPAAAEFAGLDFSLEQRGYRVVDPTLVLSRPVTTGRSVGLPPVRLPSGAAVMVCDTLTPEWFRLWWSVDGRGGDTAARAAQRILSATPSRYVAVLSDGVTCGVARLTATPGFGALACVAVAAEARERGFGRLLLDTALAETAGLGLGALQLQVVSANPAAAWYQRAGFRPESGYHYRVQPGAA
jgi:GNAT superfamily N-acetyltransferase